MECKVDDCQREVRTRGLCHNHYNQQWDKARRPPREHKPKPDFCLVADCGRDVVATGLCRGHYNQQWRGVPFTPLRARVYIPGTEQGRVCTTCREFKAWDRFYLNSAGMRRSKCKTCLIKAQTRTNERKAA